jgi:RHH-type transcriptional regulator, rel operon repressor / antitoxin RelB
MPSSTFTEEDDSTVDKWQVAGVKQAMDSMDRGKGVPNKQVESWVRSWSEGKKSPTPR